MLLNPVFNPPKHASSSEKCGVNKKINLGLDLQGGSYLLLKIDNDPVIIKELQNKAISLKNVLKENNISILNIRVTDDKKILLSIIIK